MSQTGYLSKTTKHQRTNVPKTYWSSARSWMQPCLNQWARSIMILIVACATRSRSKLLGHSREVKEARFLWILFRMYLGQAITPSSSWAFRSSSCRTCWEVRLSSISHWYRIFSRSWKMCIETNSELSWIITLLKNRMLMLGLVPDFTIQSKGQTKENLSSTSVSTPPPTAHVKSWESTQRRQKSLLLAQANTIVKFTHSRVIADRLPIS